MEPNIKDFIKLAEYENTGQEWSGYDKAIDFCDKNSLSYGSMQRGAPTAIFADGGYVSKWRNLSNKDIRQMWGYIVCPDKRFGKAIIFKRKDNANR